MLEEDIKALYERMATADPPPSKISIPSAGRAGRARLNRRRATAVATPLLAAVAVIAIALTGAIQGGLHRQQRASGPLHAPKAFSVLVPYARFGWLPRSTARTISLEEDILDLGEVQVNVGSVSLWVGPAGTWQVIRHTPRCEGFPIGRRVGPVDGHAAYWYRFASDQGRPQAGTLVWQYAAGGCAVLSGPSEHDTVKIAKNIRFGYRGEPTIRFPVQLTDVPANWQVTYTGTTQLHGVKYASTYYVAAGRVDGVFDAPNKTPLMAAGPAEKNACTITKPKHEVINGYEVRLGTNTATGSQELCASDAAGTMVTIFLGAHPALSAVSIFAHHLRLLGSNPANWTTKPIKN